MAYVRPPFTGKHETSTSSADKGPHEGGGSRVPPYGEDLFQRVVDINFGSFTGTGESIFVSGDYSCYLRAATIPNLTLEQDWKGLGPLMFGTGGGNYGSTYAMINSRPTFLMCGSGDNYTYYDHGPIIAISHDGDHWETVFRVSANDDPAGVEFYGYAVHDLVWDPEANAFFAQTSEHIVLRSRTGYGWAVVPDNFYNHCPYGIPDGVFGYDPDNNTIITPDDVNQMLGGIDSSGFYASCTAFCNGIWMAGGGGRNGSATISSIDGGQTWAFVTEGRIGMQGNYDVLCISGGPLQDFPNEN